MTYHAHTPGVPAARNGIPRWQPYVRHAHRPAWMHTALAAAQAEHGPPVPTCLCGHRLAFRTGAYAVCGACGKRSYGSGDGD